MSECIVITSGKGGVGKTTTTANLGVALALMGKKVAVVDADIGLRNLDLILGLENRIVYDLVNVIEGECRLKQALIKDKRTENLFLLPAAQTRDKSWENTLDSLRGVKPVKAYLSDWRRDNPVRPVIFSDPGRLSAEAVHLHLEHRLAQRLLSRFLSQGFLHHELSRACVLPSRDPQPRVVVLGRLSLFGQGAARLHDELITVMADWHPGDDRSTALKPQLQAGKEATWGMLQEALQIAESGGLPAVDTARFQAMAEQDVMALLPLLKQQSEAALEAAAALLKQRGSTEAQALKEVLRDQRKRINATLRQRTRELAKLDRQAADAEPTALIPGLEEQINVPALDLAKLSSQERKQLSADQRHWARRLETIEAELSSEPQRIVDSYRVVTHRLEPAGLVYLWPISG